MGALEKTHAAVLPNAHPAQQELNEIAKRHGLTFEQMRSRCRTPQYVAARREAYLALDARKWSSTRIAALFRKDHTTVLHALGRTAAARSQALEELRDLADEFAIGRAEGSPVVRP